MFLPSGPSALTAAGNSADLPGVTTFGRKPCCAAWVQKLMKVGGGSTEVITSQPADLNAAILGVKFSTLGSNRPVATGLDPALGPTGGMPWSLSANALPSESFGHSAPAILLVGTRSHTAMKVPISCSAPQKK